MERVAAVHHEFETFRAGVRDGRSQWRGFEFKHVQVYVLKRPATFAMQACCVDQLAWNPGGDREDSDWPLVALAQKPQQLIARVQESAAEGPDGGHRKQPC